MSSYFMGVCCPQCGELAYATVNTNLRYNAVSCDDCGYSDYAEHLGNEQTVEDAERDSWEVYLGEEGFWKIRISLGYGTIWFAKKKWWRIWSSILEAGHGAVD